MHFSDELGAHHPLSPAIKGGLGFDRTNKRMKSRATGIFLQID